MGDCIWDKERIGVGYYIRKQHELICFYRPKGARRSYFLKNLRKKKLKSCSHGSSRNKSFRSVIRLRDTNGGEFGAKPKEHINETNPELWRDIIKFFCPSNGYTLDPFMGIGSVGIMCRKLNRNYFGIEIEENYRKRAEERIERTSSDLITNYL
ncbi:MAG: hypothetical protein GF353_28645 [Candidatus Lokiarchaeota archaeon]|nr:hypothetical protein [Candidatus Lokiarchaeota archaeon]MBD3353972.1 hypothetical protein [Candidatus Lokiarchaeota archaeon]